MKVYDITKITMATYIDEYTVKGAKRLVKYGFIKPEAKEKYKGISPEKFNEWVSSKKEEAKKKGEKWDERQFEKDADMDWMELQRDQLISMPYPKPISRYYVVYESFHEAIEPIYFWCLNHTSFDWGFPVVHKITDIFTASEHSTFYGAAAQRLGLAQDKVTQYLATIGKMTKDLFGLVRELRWMDERWRFYKEIFEPEEAKTPEEETKREERRKNAETVLKGLWVDLVDGVVQGQRTAANLFLMAQQLQFASLPPLFFSIHPKNKEEIYGEIEPKAYNRDLKTALTRKLEQYVAWRDATYHEMKQRRKYTLGYLYQHYEVIRMYIQWIKPYLKHIEKLTGAAQYMNRAELVSSFEGSMLEIEFLAQKLHTPKNKEVYSCLLMTFEYKTKPQLSFQSEGYQHRGPIHVGETKITWRSYAWTQDQIEKYIKMKADEDFEMLTSLDESLRAAMEALGGDLENYLKEKKAELAEEEKKQEEKKEGKEAPKEPSAWTLFTDIGGGFKELFSPFIPELKKAAVKEGPSEDDKDDAKKGALLYTWQHYKNFKKAHGMVAW